MPLGCIHLNHAFTTKTFRLNKSFVSIEVSVILRDFQKNFLWCENEISKNEFASQECQFFGRDSLG